MRAGDSSEQGFAAYQPDVMLIGAKQNSYYARPHQTSFNQRTAYSVFIQTARPRSRARSGKRRTQMRAFLIVVLVLAGAGIFAATASADKFQAHLTREQVKTNCINSGGYYEDHTQSGGYSCTLPNEKFDCTNAGVCTIGKARGAVSIQTPPATLKTSAKISSSAAASKLVTSGSPIATSNATFAAGKNAGNTTGATNKFGAGNTIGTSNIPGASNTSGASVTSGAGKSLNGRPVLRQP